MNPGETCPTEPSTLGRLRVVVKGGGDLATGVAHRLHRSGMQVIVTELPEPTVIRRVVAFAEAVYEGEVEIEGVRAHRVDELDQIELLLNEGLIPVVVDPQGTVVPLLLPCVVVDATIAKRNLGTRIDDAPIVIGLGPGFTAGQDVHAVVETMRGHDLGRVILSGSALADTGVPGDIAGHGRDRVLWAPGPGRFRAHRRIGDQVKSGEVVADVGGRDVRAAVSGVVRGILRDGLQVIEGQKVGDVDPRGVKDYCYTISDKARGVAGGVLEAILYLLRLAPGGG